MPPPPERRPRVAAARLLAVLAGLACAALAGSALADRALGTFRSWSALSFTEDGAPACMLWSQPRRSEGAYTRRGEVFVFVTHRPAERRFDRVTLEMGYPVTAGEPVSVRVDGERWLLDADGSTAWARDEATDRRLVAAMRAGREMVVEGTSRRGTHTRDVYSLHGFTAAHRAIDRACPRR